MAGAGGADRAYDLGAGSYITDHVSVLDLDASGGGIHAVTS